jgi:hypothetical protein
VGRRNYLVEGVSCSGKTSDATELERRGYHVIHADRELKYRGDRKTGAPTPTPETFRDDRARAEWISEHLCWPADKVEGLAASTEEPATFFCGGSRNSHQFLHLFDAVFVLDIDSETLNRRLDDRADDDWGGKGRHAERELVLRLHRTQEDVPDGIRIDATAPLERVVDEILSQCGLPARRG